MRFNAIAAIIALTACSREAPESVEERADTIAAELENRADQLEAEAENNVDALEAELEEEFAGFENAADVNTAENAAEAE